MSVSTEIRSQPRADTIPFQKWLLISLQQCLWGNGKYLKRENRMLDASLWTWNVLIVDHILAVYGEYAKFASWIRKSEMTLVIAIFFRFCHPNKGNLSKYGNGMKCMHSKFTSTYHILETPKNVNGFNQAALKCYKVSNLILTIA